jgi:protein tyrosine phosphatase
MWVPLEDVQRLEQQKKVAVDLMEDLTNMVESAKKIIAEIMETPGAETFSDSMIVPCKAPCGREFEFILSKILALQTALNGNNQTIAKISSSNQEDK